MPVRATVLSLMLTAATCCGAGVACAEEQPTRVVAGMANSDAFLADLEHLIVELAKEKTQWEENVKPNLEIFLLGVDTQRPLRFDPMFDSVNGMHLQPNIPVADMKSFIEDNLDPIGITVKRKGKTADRYWTLSGNVYEGWMREVDDYAVIAKTEVEVPARMVGPATHHAGLLDGRYDLGARLTGTADDRPLRESQFAKLQENVLAGVQKRPTESAAAFALRQKTLEQQFQILGRLFTQTAELSAGWNTDAAKSEGHGELQLAALADTDLAAYIALVGAKASYFAAVPAGEDPVFSGRMNIPIDELLKTQYTEAYALTRTVAEEAIDGHATSTAEQKTARKQMANLFFDMLQAGLDVGAVDGFVEIVPDGAGKHTVVLGIRAADGEAARKIVELIPAAEGDLDVQLDAQKEGEVSIHVVSIKNTVSETMESFFGPSGKFYVGTHKDAVYIAGGDKGLDALKAAIKTVAETTETEADGTLLHVAMHAAPVLDVTHKLMNEGDFSLFRLLREQGILMPKAPVDTPLPAAKKEGQEGEGKSKADALKSFQWRETAVKAMTGEDDRMELTFKRVDDRIESNSFVAKGVLRAVGKLIAKFAQENLQ